MSQSFHFDCWLRLQSKAKQEEVKDQLDRDGIPVWIEETQIYIVVFTEHDEAEYDR